MDKWMDTRLGGGMVELRKEGVLPLHVWLSDESWKPSWHEQ